MIDAVGTITDTARKLPSHWSLRNRKHEKKASQIGEKNLGSWEAEFSRLVVYS